jgi:hypothetical protein
MERYPGERQALGLFLLELRPVAERELGRDALLFQAIRRALRTASLDHLRQARQLFNHLPRAQKARLSSGIVGAAAKAAAAAEAAGPPPGDPPAVRFEAGAGARSKGGAPRVSFDAPGRAPSAERPTIAVIIPEGTLPRMAADQLRRIAAMIEADRRLLSGRFWRQAPDWRDPAAERGKS